jgi:uncharacterized protein (TIGR00369 family)
MIDVPISNVGAGGSVERSRSYTWTDPHELETLVRSTSGLDFMRAIIEHKSGTTPFMATVGFTTVAAKEGYVEMECALGEHLYNPLGVVHGGVAATLLDSVAGCAVHTLLPVGTGYTSLDLSVHYLRPMTSDLGSVRAVGTAINRGRRTALSTAEIRDNAGRVLAHATSSCLLFDPSDIPGPK